MTMEKTRINVRIILSIVVVISILALLFTFMQVQQEKERLTIDLQRRASLLAESLKESIEPLLGKEQSVRLQKIVDKFGDRERLAGMAVYDVKDKLLATSPPLAGDLSGPPASPEILLTRVPSGRGNMTVGPYALGVSGEYGSWGRAQGRRASRSEGDLRRGV